MRIERHHKVEDLAALVQGVALCIVHVQAGHRNLPQSDIMGCDETIVAIAIAEADLIGDGAIAGFQYRTLRLQAAGGVGGDRKEEAFDPAAEDGAAEETSLAEPAALLRDCLGDPAGEW